MSDTRRRRLRIFGLYFLAWTVFGLFFCFVEMIRRRSVPVLFGDNNWDFLISRIGGRHDLPAILVEEIS